MSVCVRPSIVPLLSSTITVSLPLVAELCAVELAVLFGGGFDACCEVLCAVAVADVLGGRYDARCRGFCKFELVAERSRGKLARVRFAN